MSYTIESIITWDNFFKRLGYKEINSTYSNWSWYETPSGHFRVGIKYKDITYRLPLVFNFTYNPGEPPYWDSGILDITVHYDRYITQVLKALVDPYQVPLCIGISWAKRIVELLLQSYQFGH